MPYEILTGKKLDLSNNLYSWGTQVWIHDTSGSKLNGHAKEGRWVGFDDQSKRHRIYWEEKRSVTVERSINFIPDDVDIQIGNVPVDGENETFENLLEHVDNQPIHQSTEHGNNEHPATSSTKVPTAIENEPEIAAEVTSGCGKRIQKESAYVRRIREGEGTASGQNDDTAIPKGIQLLWHNQKSKMPVHGRHRESGQWWQ